MGRHHAKPEDVLGLSLFRIVLAALSLSFFLYLFLSEVALLRGNKQDVERYVQYEVQFRVLVQSLIDEQSLLVHHITGQHYSKPEAINTTDSMYRTVRKAVASRGDRAGSVLERMDHLNDFRGSVLNGTAGLLEVIVFYESLVVDMSVVWISHCTGSLDAFNRVAMQDLYHQLINQAISMQRDLLIAILLHNNTPTEHALLTKYSLQYPYLDTVLIANAFLYSSEELEKFYTDLFTDPIILGALVVFNDMTRLATLPYADIERYKANNCSLPGYAHFDIDSYETAFYTILGGMDKVDTVGADPSFQDLIVRFVLAILGLIFQLVVTISLFRVAVPALISLSEKSSLRHPSATPYNTSKRVEDSIQQRNE